MGNGRKPPLYVRISGHEGYLASKAKEWSLNETRLKRVEAKLKGKKDREVFGANSQDVIVSGMFQKIAMTQGASDIDPMRWMAFKISQIETTFLPRREGTEKSDTNLKLSTSYVLWHVKLEMSLASYVGGCPDWGLGTQEPTSQSLEHTHS